MTSAGHAASNSSQSETLLTVQVSYASSPEKKVCGCRSLVAKMQPSPLLLSPSALQTAPGPFGTYHSPHSNPLSLFRIVKFYGEKPLPLSYSFSRVSAPVETNALQRKLIHVDGGKFKLDLLVSASHGRLVLPHLDKN